MNLDDEVIDDLFLEDGETVLHGGPIYDCISQERWTGVLTTDKLFKLANVDVFYTLEQIYSVAPDPENPLMIKFTSLSGNINPSNSSIFKNVLETQLLICDSINSCTDWLTLLEKLVRDHWQDVIENDVLQGSLHG